MGVLSKGTTVGLGLKTGKAAAKHPGIMRAVAPPVARGSFKVAKPLIKRRARQQAASVGDALRALGDAAKVLGETLVTYGPPALYELGLIEPPKQKRSAPRIALGVLIGATAVYFLEPGVGGEHRQQVANLIS